MDGDQEGRLVGDKNLLIALIIFSLNSDYDNETYGGEKWDLLKRGLHSGDHTSGNLL